MSVEGRITTVTEKIEPFIAGMETGKAMLVLASAIGVPPQGYVFFILGIIYDESQRMYREDFGLNGEQADSECLDFWKQHGMAIKDRLLNSRDNWLS